MKISRKTRNMIAPMIADLRTDTIVGNDRQDKSRSTLVAERRRAADALATLLGMA
jgi:hypothetical protein